jgi:hypothetical protein
VTKDVLNVGNVVEIPAECVAMTGYNLKVGFYGTAGDTVAIPTIWADLGMVTDAADPSGDTSTNPLLPVWAQIWAELEKISQNGGNASKEDVERLVEAYLAENPPQGKPGEDGISPTVTVEDIEGGHRLTIKDATGTKTVDVMDGTEGAVLYTAQELTEDQKAQARTNIGAADAESILPLTEAQTITSVNLYDPSLQTEETISPHYWVNGAPYSSTQFDSAYNCTAPISIEPGVTYTIGLVPAVTGPNGEMTAPWNTSGQGVQFFEEDGTFIESTGSTTFTTPAKAAYIRFNYFHSGSVASLSKLEERCMIVKGDTLPESYSKYGSYETSSLLERLSSYSPPVQYHIANNVLKVASPYKADKDLLVTMNLGRGNGLFDFASFKLMPRGMDIESGEAFAETLMTNGTDWHAPFIVRATENADGDDVGSAYFTGGNHQYNNQGSGSSATARSVSLRFFVDGREVVSDKGYANKIEICWVNNVQGYNTRKADGTGREILQERHRLIFDGIEWSETIELEPLETVFMERWYGLQFVYTNNYPNYRYIGSADRTLHTNEESDCGGKDADGIVAYGDEHKIEMTIDTSVDLGKRTLSGETGALCSDAKAYMFIIDYKQMEAGEVYRLCGGYKFMSA